MSRLATRFKGKWVNVRLTGDDGYFTCLILGTARENGEACYIVRYEHGGEDLIFMTSVDRIAVSAHKPGGQLILIAEKKIVEN